MGHSVEVNQIDSNNIQIIMDGESRTLAAICSAYDEVRTKPDGTSSRYIEVKRTDNDFVVAYGYYDEYIINGGSFTNARAAVRALNQFIGSYGAAVCAGTVSIAVCHDETLTGTGLPAEPLGVAPGEYEFDLEHEADFYALLNSGTAKPGWYKVESSEDIDKTAETKDTLSYTLNEIAENGVSLYAFVPDISDSKISYLSKINPDGSMEVVLETEFTNVQAFYKPRQGGNQVCATVYDPQNAIAKAIIIDEQDAVHLVELPAIQQPLLLCTVCRDSAGNNHFIVAGKETDTNFIKMFKISLADCSVQAQHTFADINPGNAQYFTPAENVIYLHPYAASAVNTYAVSIDDFTNTVLIAPALTRGVAIRSVDYENNIVYGSVSSSGKIVRLSPDSAVEIAAPTQTNMGYDLLLNQAEHTKGDGLYVCSYAYVPATASNVSQIIKIDTSDGSVAVVSAQQPVDKSYAVIYYGTAGGKMFFKKVMMDADGSNVKIFNNNWSIAGLPYLHPVTGKFRVLALRGSVYYLIEIDNNGKISIVQEVGLFAGSNVELKTAEIVPFVSNGKNFFVLYSNRDFIVLDESYEFVIFISNYKTYNLNSFNNGLNILDGSFYVAGYTGGYSSGSKVVRYSQRDLTSIFQVAFSRILSVQEA
ncbi:MAG: hypothetical protein LBS01_02295 [Prevotellaceae bacterium]|nr:hypothetical protein [Prevotellaceae bacterium]